MRRRIATISQFATSDEPPAARNGVVRPVSGMTRVTPPMTTLSLAPGARVVELRNPAAAPVVRRSDARAGQAVTLAHRFGAAEGGR